MSNRLCCTYLVLISFWFCLHFYYWFFWYTFVDTSWLMLHCLTFHKFLSCFLLFTCLLLLPWRETMALNKGYACVRYTVCGQWEMCPAVFQLRYLWMDVLAVFCWEVHDYKKGSISKGGSDFKKHGGQFRMNGLIHVGVCSSTCDGGFENEASFRWWMLYIQYH